MIECKKVDYCQGHQQIFSGLTFRLERGQYLVLSGAARSGKTTLVRALTGLIRPDAGDIIIDGEYLEDIIGSRRRLRELRRRIGGVGGIYAPLNDRTILENVALSSEIAGLPGPMARRSAMEACGRYHLTHVATKYPDSVSEVERRATLLARAEAARKDFIIADSPTDGLDDKSARFINERLSALRLSGATILYLTTGEGPANGPDAYMKIIDGKVTS